MSEVKVSPININLGGTEYELVFNLNAIETAMERYKKLEEFMKALRGDDHQRTVAVKTALHALTAEAADIYNEKQTTGKKIKSLSEKEVGRLLKMMDVPIMVGIILEALNRSLPEPIKKGSTESKN